MRTLYRVYVKKLNATFNVEFADVDDSIRVSVMENAMQVGLGRILGDAVAGKDSTAEAVHTRLANLMTGDERKESAIKRMAAELSKEREAREALERLVEELQARAA